MTLAIGVAAIPLFLFEARAQERVLTFGAAGDFSSSTNAAGTLSRLSRSNASLFLALGDLSYGGTGSEAPWCSFVNTYIPSGFPFELISGNHEDNGPDGIIDNFVQCLPDQTAAVQGIYGKQYYFDYPVDNPLVRFIFLSPGLTFTYGGSYSYSVGSANFVWTTNAIDGARANGIPWVVVGTHELCLSAGGPKCDLGQDLTDLLVDKRVDLILHGHVHNYQRSKQLTCAVRTVYIPECVSASGDTYTKGAGSVFLAAGTGGKTIDPIDSSDPDFQYMARTMGSGTPGFGNGFVSYTVRPDSLYVQTSFSGSFVDSFSIVKRSAAPPPASPSPSGSSFSFTATGDFTSSTNAASTLTRIASSGSNFTLALGDYSYAGTGSEPAWCSFVTTRVGASYPFELISGDHEDNGPDGLIDNFTACLPDHVGSLTGTYGKQYYFDYPGGSPLARFISIGAGLTFTNGGSYAYKVGTSQYSWLIGAIDGARANGIPWVIVAMHKVCLSAGASACDVGQDLMDLLTAKRVDLVLEAHDGSYQRTKQLTCGIRKVFVPECVTYDGSTANPYRIGSGTVFVTAGVGGKPLDSINTADTELPYFTQLMGKGTVGAGYGFVKFTVFNDHLSAQTSFSGTWSDAFSIVGFPTADFTYSPTAPRANDALTFSATGVGGAPPYTFAWDFGDGSTGSGSPVTHTYTTSGTYSVTLTTMDAGGKPASPVTKSISVAPPLLVADFTFDPSSPAAGDLVNFTATATGGVSPYAFTWDFGDGNVSSGQVAGHTYGSAGSFVVTLVVTDSGGQTATVSKTVTIQSPP